MIVSVNEHLAFDPISNDVEQNGGSILIFLTPQSARDLCPLLHAAPCTPYQLLFRLRGWKIASQEILRRTCARYRALLSVLTICIEIAPTSSS